MQTSMEAELKARDIDDHGASNHEQAATGNCLVGFARRQISHNHLVAHRGG